MEMQVFTINLGFKELKLDATPAFFILKPVVGTLNFYYPIKYGCMLRSEGSKIFIDKEGMIIRKEHVVEYFEILWPELLPSTVESLARWIAENPPGH
jgi:hypothetical protein